MKCLQTAEPYISEKKNQNIHFIWVIVGCHSRMVITKLPGSQLFSFTVFNFHFVGLENFLWMQEIDIIGYKNLATNTMCEFEPVN